MFDQLKTMAGGVLGGGNVDPQAVDDAASDHINTMDGNELGDHLDTAGQNLQQSGQGDLAQQVMSIASQARDNPDAAKSAAIDLIKNNPQIIQHFAPSFAQGILGKLGL